MARIAFLVPNLGGGGMERVALTLVGGFAERGHEVDLVVMEKRGELLGEVPDGVNVIELKVSRIRSVLRPLIRYLRERRPDAIQISMWPLTVIDILAARLLRVPMRVVVSDHSSLSQQYRSNRLTVAWIRSTIRLFYPLADARIGVSRGTAQNLAKLSGLPEEQFTIIYNPVPAPAEQLPRTDVEARWGSAKARIISVGTLKNQKNHALLIKAFADFARAHDAKLLILGEGELRPELQRLIDDLGLVDRAELVGFVVDTAPYYASADLFVLSSDYEGFALVLVEALHAGLKIVSTDCPDGPAEILDYGKFGRLVRVGDRAGLAAAMAGELADARDSQAQRSRAADFADDAAVEAYLQVLLPPRAELSSEAAPAAPLPRQARGSSRR
jgi:glycosyltransferase involved in cell wall biosynthesis